MKRQEVTIGTASARVIDALLSTSAVAAVMTPEDKAAAVELSAALAMVERRAERAPPSRCGCATLTFGKWRADPACRLCAGSGLPPGVGLRRFLARREKAARRREKGDETSAIWDACWVRCGGICECGCGRAVHRDPVLADMNSAATLDHWFGRGQGRLPQSERTCWILSRSCHLYGKTVSAEGARIWHEKFIAHCVRYGYAREAEEARKRLEGIITVRDDEKQRRAAPEVQPSQESR